MRCPDAWVLTCLALDGAGHQACPSCWRGSNTQAWVRCSGKSLVFSPNPSPTAPGDGRKTNFTCQQDRFFICFDKSTANCLGGRTGTLLPVNLRQGRRQGNPWQTGSERC